METSKINFILYSAERTDGTRTVLNYANELSRRGNEVSLTTLYHDPWFKMNSLVNGISKRTKISLSLFYASTLLLNKFGKTSLSAEVSLLEKLAVMSPISDINVATFFPNSMRFKLAGPQGNTLLFYLARPGLFCHGAHTEEVL
ncbi:MAG: hypothetical protein QW478_09320 [Candidatus Micrarchaeaceae archaeon]